jgi:ParB-like nuclease domain
VNEFSIDSAREANERGELAGWVAAFLSSPGSDNAALAAALEAEKVSWCGPLRLPFDQLNRLAGPPDQPTAARLNDDDLETVEEMNESISDGWEPPPLIVSYRDSELVVEDGNHRIEGLRRRGFSDYWAVIGFDNEQQRHDFHAEVEQTA